MINEENVLTFEEVRDLMKKDGEFILTIDLEEDASE